jgi:hypothetical protein
MTDGMTQEAIARQMATRSARTDTPRLYRPNATLKHMKEITTMRSHTRIFARRPSPRWLAPGLALAVLALGQAIPTGATDGPDN